MIEALIQGQNSPVSSQAKSIIITDHYPEFFVF